MNRTRSEVLSDWWREIKVSALALLIWFFVPLLCIGGMVADVYYLSHLPSIGMLVFLVLLAIAGGWTVCAKWWLDMNEEDLRIITGSEYPQPTKPPRPEAWREEENTER